MFQTRRQQTVSGARFKLVHNLGEGRPRHDNGRTPFAAWELYDLAADPGEIENVIDRHETVARDMRAALERFVESCDASRAGADVRE